MAEINNELKENIKKLIIATKNEKDTNINNDHLKNYYKNSDMNILISYLELIKEDYYDVDKYACLFDDIRYYEEENPIIERLHQNIETSLHNKALKELKDKSEIFKDMMIDYYIIHDIECDLIDVFLELVENHINASKKEADINYLDILNKIKENVSFKYNSNIDTYSISLPMSDETFNEKTLLYLENMIIRCMYEIAKYSNEDLTKENNYAKAIALSLYLQSALVKVSTIGYTNEYKLLSESIPLESTARGIVNTAFIQEKEISKRLVRND